MKKGLVQVYTGDGKGKTTACAGLALRMAGSGGRVLYAFMQKGIMSSEVKLLETMKGIDVFRVCTMTKFSHLQNEAEKAEYRRQHTEGLEKIINLCQSGNYDMVVVDEAIGAISEKAIEMERIMDLINSRPEKCEIVLSGRKAPDELIKAADYVSDIRAVKHPFENGIQARRGIEY
jgi:cob(I)alamin adenosyltransferase